MKNVHDVLTDAKRERESALKRFRVTIKDTTAWRVTVRAKSCAKAEEEAWRLFQEVGDRSEHFEEDSETNVKSEEQR